MLMWICSPACGPVTIFMGQSPGCTARIVKYMANRPAKNISSLESQTIVPTLTMFGRVSEWTRLESNAGGAVVADVTWALLREAWGQRRRGGLCRAVCRTQYDRRRDRFARTRPIRGI